jgi:perosamine synthetase
VSIPISSVEMGPEEEALVLEVLRSGRLAQGPMVERLESAFCDLVSTRHAIATSSGTTALVAAIEALDLERGDEVITSPFTFAATLNAVLAAGATATFADIGDDFAIDPGAAAEAVTGRTRVLMPVHLYGQPADMTALGALASARGLAIVEDAAQAIGATVDGRAAGSFGLGCFSLYATKNVTTGEGGVVTTHDDALADRIRLLRNQGSRTRYQYEVPGHNYRMTELQAAIGIPQMARLDATNARRRANAAVLAEAFADLPGVVVPGALGGRRHVWHQFTLRVTAEAKLDRDGLAEMLSSRGIASGVYYPRVVFDYDCYRDHPNVRSVPVPRATGIAGEVLSLPVHPGLRDDDLGRIVDAVRAALG